MSNIEANVRRNHGGCLCHLSAPLTSTAPYNLRLWRLRNVLVSRYIHPVSTTDWHWMDWVNSPHKSQWRGALIFSLICARINGWVSNREAGDLIRYHAHCDVIVMNTCAYRVEPIFLINVLALNTCTHLSHNFNDIQPNRLAWICNQVSVTPIFVQYWYSGAVSMGSIAR